VPNSAAAHAAMMRAATERLMAAGRHLLRQISAPDRELGLPKRGHHRGILEVHARARDPVHERGGADLQYHALLCHRNAETRTS